MADNIIYSGGSQIFTLKGRIAVQFLDGEILEGEYAAQDLYNIFLTVEEQPVMIPRLQIRLITSVAGRPIEPDEWPEMVAQTDPGVPPRAEVVVTAPMPEIPPAILTPVEPPPPVIEPEPPVVEAEEPEQFEEVEEVEEIEEIVKVAEAPTPLPVEEDEAEDENEVTFILVPDAAADLYDDGEDEDDQEGSTMMLNQNAIAAALPVVEESAPDFNLGVKLDQEFELPLFPADEDISEFDLAMMLEGDMELPDVLPALSDDIITQAPAERILATLTCTGGPHLGQIFSVKMGATPIGRSVDNLVPLPQDKEISRRHAVIMSETGSILIQDQNSLNGTFVNSKQISGQHPLQNGDMVLVGVSTLKFEIR